jgi:hypothetical protein
VSDLCCWLMMLPPAAWVVLAVAFHRNVRNATAACC